MARGPSCGAGRKGAQQVVPGAPLPLLQLLLLAAVALDPGPNIEDRRRALRAFPGDLGPAGHGSGACPQLALRPIAHLGLQQ